MQSDQTQCARELEAGQLWKIEHGYIYIVELAKRHVLYRMLRQPGQTAALTRMIRLEALLCYLQQSEAVLAESPARLPRPETPRQDSPAGGPAHRERQNLGRWQEIPRAPSTWPIGPAMCLPSPRRSCDAGGGLPWDG